MMISVVIPIYNSSEHIETCLDSLVAQTYQDFEVILVNDGSTDDGMTKVEPYKSQLKIKIIDQENQGPSVARNNGVKNAQGEWVAFLDADDYWLPQKLERQVQAIEKYPNAGLFSTNMLQAQHVDKNGMHKISFKQNLIKNYFGTSCVIVRKDLFEELGGFEPNVHHSEDYLLWLKFCSITEAYVDGEPLVYHDFDSNHQRLSSDINKMYNGERFSYKEMYKNNYISSYQYVGLYLFSFVKQLRFKIFK